jgi:hypothetical protein
MDKRKYIIKIFYLLTALIFSDYIVGLGLNYFYYKQSQGKLFNLTFAMEQQDANVLIFGSSRAMHQYNPDIISDVLRLSCFNAGYDGQNILYHKALFDVITERYNPKIIILDVNTSELDVNKSSYDSLAVLNPYVKKHPVLWETLILRSPFEKIKHFSGIYPYNSLLGRIIMGNLRFKTRDISINGFTAQKGVWNDSLEEIEYDEKRLDINKINAFNKFLYDSKKRGITVYVVLSPMFRKIVNYSTSIKYIREECARQDVPFISYQNNNYFFDKGLFFDPSHLNYIGADIFSSDISNLLKTMDNFYKE